MKPLISLVTPVYNTPLKWFKQCIESVLSQTYTNWEWCLVDNGSTTSNIRELLLMYPDIRITFYRMETNIGGAEATNLAIDRTEGSYIGLLDSDDTLQSDALEFISQCMDEWSTPSILYTDEVICDENLDPVIPFYKPRVFNYDLLYRLAYFGHLTLYEASLIKNLKLRQCGGSYDYDLALRAVSSTDNDLIFSVPKILYNYRTYDNSTSALTRDLCINGAIQALQEHLDFNDPGCVAYRNDPLYKVLDPSGNKLSVRNLNLNTDEPNLLEFLLRNEIDI